MTNWNPIPYLISELKNIDTYTCFISANSDNPRQEFGSVFDEELGAVFQVPLEENEAVFTYKEMRSQAYPKIADQLDMLFHDIANNKLTERGDFYAALKAVKDTYPKS